MTDLSFAISLASELDREIEKLIEKIVNGVATKEDREEFSRLSQRRVRMMQARSAGRTDQRQNRLRNTG
jgi:hypothetical protein